MRVRLLQTRFTAAALLGAVMLFGCSRAPVPVQTSKQASPSPAPEREPAPAPEPAPPAPKPRPAPRVAKARHRIVVRNEGYSTLTVTRQPPETVPANQAAAAPPPPASPADQEEPSMAPPPPTSPPPVPVEARPAAPAPQTISNIVRVFYATDRARATATPLSYSGDESADGRLSYGTADVSLPKDHRMGELEEPILDVKILYDPEKYVTVLSTKETDEAQFFSTLKDEVAGSPRKQALIFVHGFNVSFGGALRRTAQLSYDLQFRGATICYTWPSRGSAMPWAYTADEDTVQWTAMHLKNFLQAVYDRSGATSIHLVAHSMGNRALLSALQQLGPTATPQFSDVVLAAPDVAASYFVQLIPTIQSHAKHITLYASSRDQALKVSARVNHYRRAGDTRGALTIVPPVETIDASTVDTGLLGHSYFGDSASVLSDLYYLLKDGLPAAQRSRLETRTIPAGVYWAFRP